MKTFFVQRSIYISTKCSLRYRIKNLVTYTEEILNVKLHLLCSGRHAESEKVKMPKRLTLKFRDLMRFNFRDLRDLMKK